MNRTIAIGDIHGCFNTFEKMLVDELKIHKTDNIYCLGDYIDRGNNSKAVIDLIIDLRKNGFNIYTLRGNHEQLLLDSLSNENTLERWIKSGGNTTLESFNVESVFEIPNEYISFINETKHFIETDTYVFVHAGLNFKIEDPFQDKYAMLWTRDNFIDETKISNRIVVHGHTPITYDEILNQLNPYRMNIDGGCVFKNREGYGNLIAVSLDNLELYCIPNIG